VRYCSEATLNTLKVTPMLDPEAPIEQEDSAKSVKNVFKATFGEVPRADCLVVVILPFRVPDNMCHFAAREATLVVDQFLIPSYQIQPLKPLDSQEIFRKLDVYFGSIIYQVQTLAFGIDERQNEGEVAMKQFMNLPLGSSAMQLPSILNINTNQLLQMDRRFRQALNGSHSVLLNDLRARPSVHLPLSDEVVIDACEFMHAIYDDLSSINEILSLNDPSIQLEGTAFFYNAFEVVSSLEPVYLQALTRAAVMHGMLERTNIDGSKIIVEKFMLRDAEYGLYGDMGHHDSSDEEDFIGVQTHIQAHQPQPEKKKEEEKKAKQILS